VKPVLLALCLALGASTARSGNLSLLPPPATVSDGGKIPGAAVRVSVPVKLLLIGDSLSFGTFGQDVEAFFSRQFGSSNVCVYASCGSSPEHWVSSGPEFMTPCGYRETTPRGSWKVDFAGGKPPRPTRTPKIPEILAKFRPQTVVVQLGTNWMDRLAESPSRDAAAYKRTIREFITELRAQSPPPSRIIWILPPDASKFSPEVKGSVDRWIGECAKEMGFQTILSRRIIPKYVPGKSGGDGVHLNDAEASKWANIVIWLIHAYGPD
jgi:lysophospholipase L1-like esterase